MNKTNSVRAANRLLVLAALVVSLSGCLGGGGGSEPAPTSGDSSSPDTVSGGTGAGGSDTGTGGSDTGGSDSGSADGSDAGSSKVTITQPDAAEIDTADETISLAGTATSDAAISTVTWQNDLGGNGSAMGTDNWQVTNIPLAVGANTITVTANYEDGSVSTDILVVNRESSDPDPVTLSWTAPLEREDGSALTSLAGYKLYYGRMSEIYDYEIEITNPGLQTYVVEHLEPGEWYFVITALDAAGLESAFSNEAVEQVM